MVDALALNGDEGATCDPGISEWGNLS